jgi:acyl-homoserine lactone synthase
MVHIVTKANKQRFANELDEMYRDRKRVFVDWLKWKIPVINDTYEIDRFDNDEAVYLLETDGSGHHLASIRLLPTVQPHLLSEVFFSLCDGPVPSGANIWELTRFCVSPKVSKAEGHRLMNLMWTSVVEYAVSHSIVQYTCVTHIAFLAQILSAGWDTKPLGLPKIIDDGLVGAVLFRISPKTLEDAKDRYGYRASVFDSERQYEAA